MYKLQEGFFTDIYASKENVNIVKRQYRKSGMSDKRIAASFWNECMVFKRCRNHMFVHSCIQYNVKELYFVEERAIMDLFDLCQVGSWRLETCTVDGIKAQIMSGMHALHQHGVMCIDLKLENVLVFPYLTNGEDVGIVCKLADFNMVEGKGLISTAKLEQQQHGGGPMKVASLLNTTDIHVYEGGTKRKQGTYFAPEEYEESPATVGFAADLFRLGIVMFNLRFNRFYTLETTERYIPTTREGRNYKWASELFAAVIISEYALHSDMNYLDPIPQYRVKQYKHDIVVNCCQPVVPRNKEIQDTINCFVESKNKNKKEKNI